MNNNEAVTFLQWCLPKMDYKWKGFRKVKRQLCRRIDQRMNELNIVDLSAYRDYLNSNKEEWKILDSFCYITISRFFRDRSIFNILQTEILPALAHDAVENKRKEISCWSAGCCSGEEPYTLQILWQLCIKHTVKEELDLQIFASDRSQEILERAKKGFYPVSSLKELPEEFINQAFQKIDDDCKIDYRIKEDFKESVQFQAQDIRYEAPEKEFDIILCRNLVFTYFEDSLQKAILSKLTNRLRNHGFLIIGTHERLPAMISEIELYDNNDSIYQRISGL